MSQITTSTLITAAAGLGGAVVGATASLVGGWMQYTREVNLRRREQADERQRAAAVRCDELFRQLSTELPDYASERKEGQEAADLSRRVHAAFDEIETAVIDLPAGVRERVAADLELIRHADHMSYRRYATHHDGVTRITREVAKDAHAVLAAFLRHETGTPVQSDRMIEYAAAYEDVIPELEDEFAVEIGEEENERASWLRRHPEVAAKFDRRGLNRLT